LLEVLAELIATRALLARLAADLKTVAREAPKGEPVLHCRSVFNIGAEKLLVILVVALVVLGPERLPEGMRKVGQVMAQLRNLASGFEEELRAALNEPLEEMRSTVDTVRNPLSDGEEPSVPAEPVSSPTNVEPPTG
jgi:Tat protein translocase TatB subunit